MADAREEEPVADVHALTDCLQVRNLEREGRAWGRPPAAGIYHAMCVGTLR